MPGGARGDLLKLWIPLSKVSADKRGFILEGRNILRVQMHCGRRQHHRCNEKDLSMLASPAMRWSLKVPIALSVALQR